LLLEALSSERKLGALDKARMRVKYMRPSVWSKEFEGQQILCNSDE
jgi:hypothetical protein